MGGFERDFFKFLGAGIAAAVAVRIIVNARSVGTGGAQILDAYGRLVGRLAG